MRYDEQAECSSCKRLEDAFIAVRDETLRLVLSGFAVRAAHRLEELSKEELSRLWAFLEHRATEH